MNLSERLQTDLEVCEHHAWLKYSALAQTDSVDCYLLHHLRL